MAGISTQDYTVGPGTYWQFWLVYLEFRLSMDLRGRAHYMLAAGLLAGLTVVPGAHTSPLL